MWQKPENTLAAGDSILALLASSLQRNKRIVSYRRLSIALEHYSPLPLYARAIASFAYGSTTCFMKTSSPAFAGLMVISIWRRYSQARKSESVLLVQRAKDDPVPCDSTPAYDQSDCVDHHTPLLIIISDIQLSAHIDFFST